jgi:hypothetical protein
VGHTHSPRLYSSIDKELKEDVTKAANALILVRLAEDQRLVRDGLASRLAASVAGAVVDGGRAQHDDEHARVMGG